MNISEMIAMHSAIMKAAEIIKVVIPIVVALIFVVGIFGNVLVIYVTMTTERVIKHRVHSMLVVNLAISDIIYLLASAPYQAISSAVSGWIYGSFLCPALHYVTTQTMAVSIFTMCSLALMRFIALKLPFEVQRCASHRRIGWFVIITVWILGSVISIPDAVYYRITIVRKTLTSHQVDYIEMDTNETAENASSWNYYNDSFPFDNETMSYIESYDMYYENEIVEVPGISACFTTNKQAFEAYKMLLLVFTYLIPILLVTTLYFFIGRILCLIKNKQPTVSITVGGKREQAEYVKTTVMVFCLIIAFIVCWLPHHVYNVIKVTHLYSDFSYGLMRTWLDMLGRCLSYAHACINPIIYSFAAPNFRRNLRLAFRRERCNRKSFATDWCAAPSSSRRGSNLPYTACRKSNDERTFTLALTNKDEARRPSSREFTRESITSFNLTTTTTAYGCDLQNPSTTS